jgi:fanconi anemia group J protein
VSVVNQWESRTELSLWCLNAAVPFELLSSTARSIIVTSGTLAPLDSFAGELDVNFSVTKSLPHVVDIQRQVYTSVVAVGPGMVRMDTTYRNASNFMWQDSLGFAIVDYCKIIPGGVLIFFPSYRLLNSLVQRWQSQGTWERLEHVKGTVVCESSGRGQEFEESIAAYTVGAGEPDGAVMLGVCRGKISEGLDFKDAQARGVLIIGIPYPAARDPKLVSKRAWNDRERRDNDRQELLSGSAWYDMQAFRALNQAVGRCVRHRRDFGAIVLLDQRFCAPSVAKQLPSWVRGAIRPGAPSTHEATLQGLTTFFATVEDNLPPP